MFEAILQAVISGLAVGGAYALVALGFSVTFTTTRTLNFSHGDVVSSGAFVGASLLLLSAGLPITAESFGTKIPDSTSQLLALGLAVLATGVVGLLVFMLGIRPFASRPGMSWIMSTIGFGVLVQAILLAIWGPKPLAVPSPVGDEVIRAFNVGVRPQEVLMLVVTLVVMFGFDAVMNRTMVGKAMRAVAHSSGTASLMGINVKAMMVGAFVLSSAMAGLAGFLLAPIAQASLFMGLAVGLKGFSGAMVGGLSNPRGCAIGALLLGVLESLVNLWSAQWRDVAVFALVIVVLAVRPSGLFGKLLPEKV
jgi:branched-chain amino acid transport system permease protein